MPSRAIEGGVAAGPFTVTATEDAECSMKGNFESLLGEAVAILGDAEDRMRGLLSRGAGDGVDTSELLEIARLLDGVKQVGTSIPASNLVASRSRAIVGAHQPRAMVGSRPKYPRFVREDDRLVRIAWSKTKRDEYRQFLSKPEIDQLREEIVDAIGGSEDFDGSDLIAAADAIPSHRIYIFLGWLRDRDIIEKVGRGSYRVVDPGSFWRDVEEAWESLDE